jgi:hypothetical protein
MQATVAGIRKEAARAQVCVQWMGLVMN